MTNKTHKTHFTQDKEMPWKRPITISYIKGAGKVCGFFGCTAPADYLAEGKLYCTFHWLKPKVNI